MLGLSRQPYYRRLGDPITDSEVVGPIARRRCSTPIATPKCPGLGTWPTRPVTPVTPVSRWRTGLRWGEMAALRVRDLDMPRRSVNVNRAVAEVERDLVYGTPQNHSRRSAPFPEFLEPLLQDRIRGRAEDSFVFTAPAGGALRNRNWRRRNFERAVRELVAAHSEIASLSPHDLRHAPASLAISAGANVKAVQRMLGHKSAAMTLDIYCDLFRDDLDAVGIALNAAGSAAIVGKSVEVVALRPRRLI